MELTHNHHNTLLDELIMAPKMDSCPEEDDDVGFLSNTWTALLNPLQQHNTLNAPLNPAANNPSLSDLTPSPGFMMNSDDPRRPFREFQPFLDALASPDFCCSFFDKNDDHFPILPMIQQECYDASGFLECASAAVNADMNSYGSIIGSDQEQLMSDLGNIVDVNEANLYGEVERKSKAKKLDGQPSKNLMAERRRRKRLNDRLSMLRSIVPKISKMDRTSILGDTIDYMKELLDKIHKLRGQGIEEDEEEADTNLMINKHLKLKDQTKPNEMQVRNPPKFDVERRNQEVTRIEVCCTAKPGLLLSTLSTLDAVGLDIQHCVISCFNDFCLQASCYEVAEHRSIINCEDVKQALFRNAGYGGRCL